jgi:hypothetical protein
MHSASLILLLQSFQMDFLHSQELFTATVAELHRKTQRFRLLQLHELAMVIG